MADQISQSSKDMKNFQFPKDFVWGVAAGSYQVEGGWKEGGKCESIGELFISEQIFDY